MKVAIVTGVAGGLGKASALMLAKSGYAVVGMGRSAEPDLSDFEGLDVTYVQGDISSAEDRKALLDAATGKGDVCALVNVAGVAPKVRTDILEMSEESYDYVMNINTKGTLFLTQAVANRMIEQQKGGAIVNVSSCSAYTSSTSRGEYCISKAGVSMITKLFADRGIMKKISNAHFVTALSIAVSSGLPLDDCIEQAGKLLGDSPKASKRVKECQKMMNDGESFAQALFNSGFISASSCHLLSISVQTGGTDRILEQIAERMTDNAQSDLEDTVSKLEPMLVIITSFLVGIILLSVMLPLINIMKAI